VVCLGVFVAVVVVDWSSSKQQNFRKLSDNVGLTGDGRSCHVCRTDADVSCFGDEIKLVILITPSQGTYEIIDESNIQRLVHLERTERYIVHNTCLATLSSSSH
jgi:hypothetical protein